MGSQSWISFYTTFGMYKFTVLVFLVTFLTVNALMRGTRRADCGRGYLCKPHEGPCRRDSDCAQPGNCMQHVDHLYYKFRFGERVCRERKRCDGCEGINGYWSGYPCSKSCCSVKTSAEKVRVIALKAKNAWMVLNVATVATATMREVTAKILSGGLHLGTTVAPTTPTLAG